MTSDLASLPRPPLTIRVRKEVLDVHQRNRIRKEKSRLESQAS